MNNIRKYREKHGLTLEQLSRYVGSSANSIRRWEVEEQLISYKNARILANFFCVSTDELFNDGKGEYKQSKIDKTFHDIPVDVVEVEPEEDNIFLKKKADKNVRLDRSIDSYFKRVDGDEVSDYASGLTEGDVDVLLEMVATYRNHRMYRKYIPRQAKLEFDISVLNRELPSFKFTNRVFDIVMESFSETVKHAICVCYYIRCKESDACTSKEYSRLLVARGYLKEKDSVFLKKIIKYRDSERGCEIA